MMIFLNTVLYSQTASPFINVVFIVHVYDSTSKVPLQSAEVTLIKNREPLETKHTTVTGRAVFRDVEPGNYIIRIYNIGYQIFTDSINLNESNSEYNAALRERDITTNEIEVNAELDKTVSSIDLSTGYQTFESELYHGSPTSGLTQIIQQNLVGSAKAPTGEVHINGQHGEYTYYVDGLPVPLGVFGGLNEIVDPKVIESATFITGGFPAEYGGQIAAIVDIMNRVPGGKFHLDFSSYIGSYLVFNGTKPFSPGYLVSLGKSSSAIGDTLGGRVGPFRTINSNGQSLSFSNHINKFSYYLSGSRQETDRRIDQPTATLFNDRGTDYFLFGKFDYQLNKTDYITTNLNYSSTNTQVPFDSLEQGFSPDNQVTKNAYETFSYFHTISEKKNHESNLFVGLYGRQGSLLYAPSSVSPVNFQFQGDSTLYALTEDRSFGTYGIRSKLSTRLSSTLLTEYGFNFSTTNGKENFTSRDSLGRLGPTVLSSYAGSDFGVFAQSQWNVIKQLRFDFGIRYDQHIAPIMNLQNLVSPRLKINFFINEMNTAYLYYGKIFMPNNIEGLRTIASNVSNSGIPTLPEKDDFYEIGYVRGFAFGLKTKLDFFYKYSSPGVDDQTIGSSAVKTPVNIETIRTTGVELALSYSHPKIPLTAYLNTSIIHAYGSGAVTGGFLDFSNDGDATDLDHDQRLSIAGGITYQPDKWFVSMTSVYGSGLTNGNPNGIPFGTGLFDFNKDAHVSPYIIFDISGGYTFRLFDNVTLEPSLYISNLFDNDYILKGTYFSAGSYGERRNVMLKLSLHI